MENKEYSHYPQQPLIQNHSGRSQKFQEMDNMEEHKYESERMKFLVQHPEYDFLKNHPPPIEGNSQYNSEKENHKQYNKLKQRYNPSHEQKQIYSGEKGNDPLRGMYDNSKYESRGYDDKSDASEIGQQKYYRDNSIQKLNQSLDLYQKSNMLGHHQPRQKTIEYQSNSPVKLPSIVQHLYNSVNNHSYQPASRYSQDTLKERQQRQKEIKQRLYQVMAPQESYYEQYNGFYHQNDYQMNINEDAIKRKLMMQNESHDDNYSSANFKQDNSFTNYLSSNQHNQVQDNLLNHQKNNPSQDFSNQHSDQTPIFNKKNNISNYGDNTMYRGLGRISEQVRDENDQVSTRYHQINEMNKYRLLYRKGQGGASQERKEGFLTNNPSSITSSKISYAQNIPSYSFIDHVNAQLQHIRMNQQQSHQITQNQSMLSSKISMLPDQTPVKKVRSITYDGVRDSTQPSLNNNQSPTKDPNVSSIKGYFNRKYNNKDENNVNEPGGQNYPRYDYSEFRTNTNPDQENRQKTQLKQLRQRSSRSLLQDPNLKKKAESNNFSFQNSQTEQFNSPRQKQNAVEALQNIISEAAASGQPQTKQRRSKKNSRAYIEQEEQDLNEDIILDKSIHPAPNPNDIKQSSSSQNRRQSRQNSNSKSDNYIPSVDKQLEGIQVNNPIKPKTKSTAQPQYSEGKSSFLNNAQILSHIEENNSSLNQNPQSDNEFINSTFNLQNELDRNK